MIRKHAYVLALASTLFLGGCLDEWLTTEPQTILTDEQLWSDAGLVLSVLADYYDRIPQQQGPHGGGQTGEWGNWAVIDEAVITQQTPTFGGNYGYGSWDLYAGTGNAAVSSWGLMRDIHVAMKGVNNSSLAQAEKTRFLAELRFIRAYLYFEKVKRHGGIPLITDELLYDFSGNVENLRVARAAEAEIYDFIWDELEAIKGDLPNSNTERRRATRGAVLALESRAMLYAGSIARHNYTSSLAAPILFTDPNTSKLVLGIPQARANEFYTRSLNASRELITSGGYALNGLNATDKSAAFHDIFVTKGHNEAIFVRDFAGEKIHWYGMRGRPASMKVDQFSNWAGSEVSALLNVAENFDKLDGSPGTLTGVGNRTIAGQANWIFFDEVDDIWEGRDARLKGTLLLPGGSLGSAPVNMQAGVYVWNSATNQHDRSASQTAGAQFQVPGSNPAVFDGLLTGRDGPFDGTANQNATGVFMKKYLNPDANTGRYAPGDNTWWIFFRLGEIYMNATEAAFQLGQTTEALGYINTLRQRAGFPANSLTSLTMQKIQTERWAELAFEDHRLWDLRRWRIGHEVFDNQPNTASARAWVAFPYRIYRPGHPTHNKFVYDKTLLLVPNTPRHFREGNYYSQLPGGAINNNPLLVQNPIQE